MGANSWIVRYQSASLPVRFLPLKSSVLSSSSSTFPFFFFPSSSLFIHHLFAFFLSIHFFHYLSPIFSSSFSFLSQSQICLLYFIIVLVWDLGFLRQKIRALAWFHYLPFIYLLFCSLSLLFLYGYDGFDFCSAFL